MYYKGTIKNNEIKELEEFQPEHPGDITSSTKDHGGKEVYDYAIVEAENSEEAKKKINQIIKGKESN